MKLYSIIIIILISILVILIVFHEKKYKKHVYEFNHKLKNKINSIQSINNNKINFPILYINLEKSKDREINILNEFKKYNITNFKRINGVYGNNYNFYKDDIGDFKFVNNFSDKKFTKSELGCTLSHIKAIKYAYENKLGTVLILEDDVSFDLLPLWENSLKEITQMISNDWRIIQLINLVCGIDDTIFYVKNKICYSTAAYLINTEGQKKMIDLFQNNTIILDKDVLKNVSKLNADDFIYPQIQNFYTLTLPLFFQNNTELNSTIHTQDTFGHIKRSNEIMYKYINKFTMEKL